MPTQKLTFKTAKRLEEINKMLIESWGFTRSKLLIERSAIISEKNELKEIINNRATDFNKLYLIQKFIQEIEKVEKNAQMP